MLAVLRSHRRCNSPSGYQIKLIVAVWLTGALVLGPVTRKFMARSDGQYQSDNTLGQTNYFSVGHAAQLPCAQSSDSNLGVGHIILRCCVVTFFILAVAIWIRSSRLAQLANKNAAKVAPITRDIESPGAEQALQAMPFGSQEAEVCGEFGHANQALQATPSGNPENKLAEQHQDFESAGYASFTSLSPRVDASTDGWWPKHALTETALPEIQMESPSPSGGSISTEAAEEVGSVQGNNKTAASRAEVLAAHGVRRYKLNPHARRSMTTTSGQTKEFIPSTSASTLPKMGTTPPLTPPLNRRSHARRSSFASSPDLVQLESTFH